MANKRSSASPCVMVADDDADIRAMVIAMLGTGYRVVQAEDGLSALAAMAGQPVDLVILDVEMPGIDGWEVCRRLKADSATHGIPIIMLTVRSLLRDELAMTQAQPDGFLNKPFDRADLFGQVAACLGRKPLSLHE